MAKELPTNGDKWVKAVDEAQKTSKSFSAVHQRFLDKRRHKKSGKRGKKNTRRKK